MSIVDVIRLDWRVFKNVIGAITLLVIAFFAPFFALASFEVLTPGEDSLEQWFERSGAVMTIYSAIAAAVSKASIDLISQSKDIGVKAAVTLTAKYGKVVLGIETLSLLITLLGTLVWGYGSFIIAGYLRFEQVMSEFSFPVSAS
ncbi:hypothetical protein [Pseudomonas syringae]|uniref:hypothetical protein n=1 Tax=Pseudomonas syringae TaxID=317 RepID=UPI003F770421